MEFLKNKKSILSVLAIVALSIVVFFLNTTIPVDNKNNSNNTNTTSDNSSNSGATIVATEFNGKNAAIITYKATLLNGEVFDAPNYDIEVSTSKPIPKYLFDGLIGAKKGDTRSISVSAKDAFGDMTREITIDEESIPDTYSQEFKKEIVVASHTKTESLNLYEGKKVGDVENLGNSTKTILGINKKDNTASVKYENSEPLITKAPKKGDTFVFNGISFIVSEIKKDSIVAYFKNTASPFYGKKKQVGTKVEIEGHKGKFIEIVAKNNNILTLRYDNIHPLAGQDVIFNIEVKDIINK